MKRPRTTKVINGNATNTSPLAQKIQKILRAIAFVPLIILCLERLWDPLEGVTSGYLHVENVAATTTKKKAVPRSSTRTSLINFPKEYPLQRITQNYRVFETCPRKTVKLSNVISINTVDNPPASNTIPKLLHTAVDKKCVPPIIQQRVEEWKRQFPELSIFIQDEEAMARLLKFPAVANDFPQLPQILRNCVLPSHDTHTLTKLWKYLVLYIYGGVYASMELVPTPHFSTTFGAVVAIKDNNKLSADFVMVPPRHPLLYFALHRLLQDLAQGRDNGDDDELTRAFWDFKEEGDGSGVITAGSHKGIDDHDITVINLAGESPMVKKEGGNIGIEKPAAKRATNSCKEAILMEVLDAAKLG